MPGRLIVAPAGAGKTAFVLEKAREAARAWGNVRVVVGSSRQAQAGYLRLAPKGAFGVRIHTLSGLARELLDLAGKPCILITDPIQIRFLRALVDQADLSYYAPLARMPGFIRALRDLFAELTRARIDPGDFTRQVRAMGGEPRLTELARLYALYQAELAARGWTDLAGVTACALQALHETPDLARNWDLLAVDGFTRLHPADLALLLELSTRVGEFIITMTGDLEHLWEPAVGGAWQDAWEQAARALGLTPGPLPDPNPIPNPLFSLSTHLLQSNAYFPESAPALDAIAAPDQTGEVRAALRWLKQRLVEEDDLDLADVALIARDLAPYRDAIIQTAEEFGLPITLTGGLPLRDNPAVDALMSLLNLAAPQPEGWQPQADRRYPYRGVVAAWRSPYFDWRWVVAGEEPDGGDVTLAIRPEDADALAALARWGRVSSGAGAWWDAFRRRARMIAESDEEDAWRHEDEEGLEAPRAREAKLLWRKWLCFRRAITPPRGPHPVDVFVRWLEDLIGPDEPFQSLEESDQTRFKFDFSLNMIGRIRAGKNPALIDRDIAALNAFKETLRGIVWAAQSLNLPPVTFHDFLTDLGGALEAARYEPGHHPGRRTLLASGIQSAAGLRFRAVALLGLAEGVFPATLHEDAFLRGEDRQRLQEAGWEIAPSPDNQEGALFYLAVSRANERILITRPRLAEGGSDWQPSPYWLWLTRSVGVAPVKLTHENALFHASPASMPELMLSLALHTSPELHQAQYDAVGPERLARWKHGARVAAIRYKGMFSPFEGDLSSLADQLSRRYGPDYAWSPGSLETYRSCPYRFFASRILRLKEREAPMLGPDNRQLGNIYHRALERVFRQGADVADDAEALIAIWDAMADELLDEAPGKDGFRPTAWWPQTREQIKTVMRRTLEAMAEENAGWRPRDFEASFGGQSATALALSHPDQAGTLRVRGFIDRVDIDGQGGMRVVDYKMGDVARYSEKSLMEGKHLQLPLYALAAERVMEYGQIQDAFYWSVTRAKSSDLRLGKFGVEEAAQLATEFAWQAAEGVRAGRFQPHPAPDSCKYCPAAGFCWQALPERR